MSASPTHEPTPQEELRRLIVSRRVQCSAISVSTGERCKRAASYPYTRCSKHKPKKSERPKGMQKVEYQAGLYASVLPKSLLEVAERSASDPNILALTDAIATLDARMVQLLRGLERDDAGRAAWQELRTLVDRMDEALLEGEEARQQFVLREMRELLNSQMRIMSIWQELYSGFEMRRKLSESESKRREKMQSMMTAEQAAVLVHRVAQIVKLHVKEPEVLQNIGIELFSLVGGKGPIPTDHVDPPDPDPYEETPEEREARLEWIKRDREERARRREAQTDAPEFTAEMDEDGRDWRDRADEDEVIDV